MKHRTLLAALLLLPLLGSTGRATQQPPADAATPAKPAAAQPSAGQNAADSVNVKLELTISIADAKGTPVVSKGATLHVVDRDSGRIRVHNSQGPQLSSFLNVDATPVVIGGDRVRVNISLEYTPSKQDGQLLSLSVNQRVSAVVQSGKPVLISQTTEPGTDRHVRVELKATILK